MHISHNAIIFVGYLIDNNKIKTMQSRIENLIRDYKIKIKSFDSKIESKRKDVTLERHNAQSAHVEPMEYADFVYERKYLQGLQNQRQQLLQVITDLESILELEGVYE